MGPRLLSLGDAYGPYFFFLHRFAFPETSGRLLIVVNFEPVHRAQPVGWANEKQSEREREREGGKEWTAVGPPDVSRPDWLIGVQRELATCEHFNAEPWAKWSGRPSATTAVSSVHVYTSFH